MLFLYIYLQWDIHIYISHSMWSRFNSIFPLNNLILHFANFIKFRFHMFPWTRDKTQKTGGGLPWMWKSHIYIGNLIIFFLNELFSGFETSGHISLSILCLIKFITLLITETEISFGLAALMKRSCSLELNYPIVVRE